MFSDALLTPTKPLNKEIIKGAKIPENRNYGIFFINR